MISKLPWAKHKILATVLLLVDACAGQSEMQRAFLVLFPSDDVNQTLVLAPLDPSGGAASIKQATTFILSNKSGVPVVYNPANGVHGLAWDEATQQWEEIRNKVEGKNAP